MIAIPFPWKLTIGTALVTIALGAMWLAFREGKQAAHADNLENTIETQRSITDADARGPRTPDDVDRRLRDGNF